MIPILNVLWGIVAGERYDYKEPRMTALIKMLRTALEVSMAQPDVTWFLPVMSKLFPSLELNLDGYRGEPGDIKHFLNQTIQHHMETFEDNNIRDFIDAYLIEINVRKKENIILKKCFYLPKTYFRKEKKELVSTSPKVMNSWLTH